MGKVVVSEWMWRFLAIVMTFSVGWTMWIIHQLNPPPLILSAAYAAAAKANARSGGAQSEKQTVQGVIASSAGATAASTAAEAPAVAPAVTDVPKEPPINADKLKFSDSITLPVPNPKK